MDESDFVATVHGLNSHVFDWRDWPDWSRERLFYGWFFRPVVKFSPKEYHQRSASEPQGVGRGQITAG